VNAPPDINAPGEPNVTEGLEGPFRLVNLTNLQRISRQTIETLAARSAGNPAAQFAADGLKQEGQFRDQLHSLVPQDSNTVDSLPLVVEFKPNMSYYVIKNISVKRINQDEYEGIKTQQVFREDFILSQSLAAVHFNPENILKRMNFRWATQEKEPIDANIPAESEEGP